MIIKRRNDKQFRFFQRSLVELYRQRKLLRIPLYDLDLWEQIFIWHFASLPQGNTDARWDELFVDHGALQANDRVRAVIKRSETKIKQKAA